MIDLRFKGLPDHITVAGSPFLIKTDFRLWLNFEELLKKPQIKLADMWEYFSGNLYPTDPDETLKALMEFYTNPNSTPHYSGQGSNERVVDYIEDGEYIVASFIQAYGIDLTEVDHMHWHKFKALFNSLPEDTQMSKIIGYRSYKKSKKDAKTIYMEQKKAWSLPTMKREDEQALLAEINAEFYNS